MKKIKIGQIGIGHNHGEAKMLAVRKFPELFEIVGYAEENECWIEKRGNKKGYEGLSRLSVEEIIKQSDAVLVESDVWNLTKYAKMCVDAVYSDISLCTRFGAKKGPQYAFDILRPCSFQVEYECLTGQ